SPPKLGVRGQEESVFQGLRDYGQHLLQVERFEKKMKRPPLSGLYHGGVGGAVARHQDDLEQRVAALEQPKQAEAVAVLQSQIHQSSLKFMPLHLPVGARGARCRLDLVITELECPAK